MHTEYSIIRM